MRLLLVFLLGIFLAAPVHAYGTDRDVDNDGQWDADKGGTDRDIDNDGQWDAALGGTDRDTDNDGQWDYHTDEP